MRGKRLFILTTTFSGVLLFPGAVMADNCGGMIDCHGTIWAALLAILAIALFIALLPYLPAIFAALLEILNAYTFYDIGKKLITGEKLAWWQIALDLAPSGKLGKVLPKNLLKKLPKDIEEWLGKGFKVERKSGSDLMLKSKDGTKSIRFDIKNSHGDNPHINIQTWKPRNKYPGDKKMVETSNIHIYPKPK